MLAKCAVALKGTPDTNAMISTHDVPALVEVLVKKCELYEEAMIFLHMSSNNGNHHGMHKYLNTFGKKVRALGQKKAVKVYTRLKGPARRKWRVKLYGSRYW